MKGKKVLFILRRPPYGSSLAREAIEATLAFGSFEHNISLLFIDDGVLQLLSDQQPAAIHRKNHGAMLQALPLYDVDQLFAEGDSLKARHLNTDDIPASVTVINTSAIQVLMAEHDHILSF